MSYADDIIVLAISLGVLNGLMKLLQKIEVATAELGFRINIVDQNI